MAQTRNHTSRITAGLLLALALGTFGPIQRAVSHESMNYIEISGPLFEDGDGYPFLSLWAQSTHGAGARWEVPGDGSVTTYTLMAAIGDNATGTVSERAYDVSADNDRRAALTVRICPNESYYSCESHTWTGANTFSHDPAFTRATFVGTLVDADGASCEIDATWDARIGHNVIYRHGAYPLYGHTRTPASLDLDTTCIGSHLRDGSDEAEIWTQTVATP